MSTEGQCLLGSTLVTSGQCYLSSYVHTCHIRTVAGVLLCPHLSQSYSGTQTYAGQVFSYVHTCLLCPHLPHQDSGCYPITVCLHSSQMDIGQVSQRDVGEMSSYVHTCHIRTVVLLCPHLSQKAGEISSHVHTCHVHTRHIRTGVLSCPHSSHKDRCSFMSTLVTGGRWAGVRWRACWCRCAEL